MSNEERASPLELLRAGVTQGKQRVQVHNLKNERSQLDKRRTQAVVELGEQAWEQRVKHPDYSPTFAQLVKLERERSDLQSQLDDVLTTISQQERLKGQLNEGFATRLDEVQAQKRATAARLSKVMSRKQAASQSLGEGQEPNTAEIERLNGELQAIQEEIRQYESELTAISDEQAGSIGPIEQQLSQLQNQVRTIKEQVTALVSQMKPIMPVLGERVLTVRPEAAQLAEHYQQIDGYDRQLAQKAEQIATLEQQITTASPTTKRVFYLLVGTAGVLVLLVGALLAFFVLRGSSEGLAVGGSRPQPQVGPDSDGDWVSDLDEETYNTSQSEVDTDGDGLTDFEEIFILLSNPNVEETDSDGDGMPDKVESQLLGTDPDVADSDRDGDLLFDNVELDRGSDPSRQDTDGDMLSDFIELFLLDSDPRTADTDSNGNGFPDVIEAWRPMELQEANCVAEVTLTIDKLIVHNAEEADSASDIDEGDEAVLKYGLWIDVSEEEQTYFVIPRDTPHTAIWKSKAQTNSQFTNFRALDSVVGECGDIATISIQLLEEDLPFGGVWDMGLWREDPAIIFNRFPLGWEYGQFSVVAYGTTADSDYEYEVFYTIGVELQK